MTNKRMKQKHVAFADWLHERAQHIEAVLDECLPPADALPSRLHEAMRYAVLGGGKRVRAALVYAAGHACPVNGSAIAIEASLDRAAPPYIAAVPVFTLPDDPIMAYIRQHYDVLPDTDAWDTKIYRRRSDTGAERG